MTQALPDAETRTRDLSTFRPYQYSPPTLRRPHAAETEVMFVVEPFGPQAPPAPCPPMPAPAPQPPAADTAVIYPRPGIVPGLPGRPDNYRGDHRRPAPWWAPALIGAGVATVAWSALGLAALALAVSW